MTQVLSRYGQFQTSLEISRYSGFGFAILSEFFFIGKELPKTLVCSITNIGQPLMTFLFEICDLMIGNLSIAYPSEPYVVVRSKCQIHSISLEECWDSGDERISSISQKLSNMID